MGLFSTLPAASSVEIAQGFVRKYLEVESALGTMTVDPAELAASLMAEVCSVYPEVAQGRRQGKPNQALQGEEMDRHAALGEAASKFLRTAAARLGWSARATHRAMKVARTIADLAGSADIAVVHIAEAVQYRRALVGAKQG